MRKLLIFLAGLLITLGATAQIRPTVDAGTLQGYDTTDLMTAYDWDTAGTNVWDALTIRCLESVFGETIGTGLTLDGTVLKTHAALQSIAGLTETNGGLLYGTADNTYAWLAAGATTDILVGGGAAAPVWTAATGTGSPVRATSPTLVTPVLGVAAATTLNTGEGDNELYDMDQNVLTTSEVQFRKVEADTVDWSIPNLLTNNDFLVNSQATVATAASGYFSYDRNDNCNADNTADYTKTDCNLTFDTDHYVMTETGATQVVSYTLSGLTVGALYKFNVDLENGTYTLTSSDNIQATTNGDAVIHSTALSTAVAYTEFSVYWVAQGATDKVKMNFNAGAGETVLIEDIQVSQVSQAYIAADRKAPDGWEKDATLDLYTVDDADSLPTGSIRGIRMVPSSGNDWLGYPQVEAELSWINKFAGRTVTFSTWVKTATASHARFEIYDGSTASYSSYHTGGDAWELLTVTVTFSATPTLIYFRVLLTQSAGQVLITQPTLSYGNSIGLYSPQKGMIYMDASITANDFNSVSVSSSVNDINIVEQSLGKVASGCKYADIKIFGSCANANKYISLGDNYDLQMRSYVGSIASTIKSLTPIISDDVDLRRDDTWTGFSILYYAIEY